MYNQQFGDYGGIPGFGGLQQRGLPGFPPEMLAGGFGAPPPPLPQQQQPRAGLSGLGAYGAFPPPPQQPQARDFAGFGGIPPPFQQPQPQQAVYPGLGGYGGVGPQLQQQRGAYGAGQSYGGASFSGAGYQQQSNDGRQQQKGGKSGGGFGGQQGGKGGGSKGSFGDKGNNMGSGHGDQGKGGKGGGGKGKRQGNQKGDQKGSQQQDFSSFSAGPPPTVKANGQAAWSYGQTAKGSTQPPDPRMGVGKGQKGMNGGKGMNGYDSGMENHSNVFVGSLQDGTSQQDLESAFGRFGKIQSCFVASGNEGRGHGFVKFERIDAAWNAVNAMNGHNGWVVKSANKDMFTSGGKGGPSFHGKGNSDEKPTHPNVFVGNLNEGISEAQLEKVFKAYGTVDSCMVINKPDKTFGFVEFSTIAEAQASIDGLNGQSGLVVKFANNDNQPTSWKDSLPHSNLFIGSLPKGMTENELQKTCEKFGIVESCSIKTETDAEKAYGFVKFSTVAAAKRAITALDGKDGWSVKVANHDSTGKGGKGDAKGFFGMMPWAFGKGGDFGKGKGKWMDFAKGMFKGSMKGGGWVWSDNRPENDRPEPEPHDNLYVKNLPLGTKDDEVVKTFSEAGDVVECRVLSWDGFSECAALVRMGSLEQATKARELFNGQVHENCHLKLSIALQQKAGAEVPDHIFVKGLHCTTSQERLQKAFSCCGEVKWAKILPLPWIPNPSILPESSGLVQFATPEEAQAAIAKFDGQICEELGMAMVVRYADEKSSDKPEAKPSSNLYVKGWPLGFPDFLLQSIFQKHGQVIRLRLLENPDPEQPTCAALVQMSKEEEATKALKALHGNTVSPPVPPMRVKHAGKDATPSGNLYVTSLPRTITDEEIKESFKKVGEVQRLKLLNQDKSAELRALVELETPELASKAVKDLDNTVPVFKGVLLSLQYASKGPGGRKGE